MSEPDRRVSFDAVAELYDRIRHSYPAEAVADLFAYWRSGGGGGDEAPDVVEIGPGTGKATRLLLAAGARVTGVELGPNMVAWLRKAFAEEAGFSVVEGAFEAVALPLESFDIVTAATAYHWVDPAVRVERCVSLLRPEGVVGVLATVQVESPAARGYFERTQPIYARYGEAKTPNDCVTPAPEEAMAPELEELGSHPLLRDSVVFRYRWDQTYSSAEYGDLLRSYSNIQIMDTQRREALITELCQLIDDEFSGEVVRPLVIVLAAARRG